MGLLMNIVDYLDIVNFICRQSAGVILVFRAHKINNKIVEFAENEDSRTSRF